jgi:hypothetical protein
MPEAGSAFAMFGGGLTFVLMVFYLYLLARWQHVRIPMLYLIGAAGLVLGMIGGFIPSATVKEILNTIGCIVAFVGVVGACFGAKLPVHLPGSLTGGSTNPPPPAAK